MKFILLSLATWAGLFIYHIKTINKRMGRRGGGDDPEIIYGATGAAPSASESSADIYKSKLEYDPKMAELEMQLQKQYAPQQAELYQSLYNQYYPEMARQQQAMQKELYPYQSQIVEEGAANALSRLQNPDYMSPQEQAALNSQRVQETEGLMKAMRERANLGGGLYGGRAAGAEAKSVSDLMQQYETQDYSRRMGAGQAAQQALNPYMQILYPQVGTQQPQVNAFQYQSAVPDANTLYNAIYQASKPQQYLRPGTQGGLNLGILGRWGGSTY